MNKFQKAAAVAVMVGGMALGNGAAYACDHGGSDDQPSGTAIDNLQAVECNQDFDGGLLFAPVQINVGGDNSQTIGNFCTVVGPDEG